MGAAMRSTTVGTESTEVEAAGGGEGAPEEQAKGAARATKQQAVRARFMSFGSTRLARSAFHAAFDANAPSQTLFAVGRVRAAHISPITPKCHGLATWVSRRVTVASQTIGDRGRERGKRASARTMLCQGVRIPRVTDVRHVRCTFVP